MHKSFAYPSCVVHIYGEMFIYEKVVFNEVLVHIMFTHIIFSNLSDVVPVYVRS